MRIFVASWFFPPNTSSEGIVTYKLLRNSRHSYDVVSSRSQQWGYKSELKTEEENIRVIPVETEDLEFWREETVRLFGEMHAREPYDAVMTRCMPSESLEVGLRIKEQFPGVKWICSLADPVGNNPYSREAIRRNRDLPGREKEKTLEEMPKTRDKWTRDWLRHPSNSIRDQFHWKDIQDQAMKKADLLICPSAEQRDYMDPEGTAAARFLVVPHSYDEELYGQAEFDAPWEAGKTHLTYTGYSDALRSLRPVVDAARWIGERYPEILQQLRIHIFGNYPREVRDRALAWQLQDVFDFQGNVSYGETLAIMKRSDWLLHIDAYFPELEATGGSIFFAGKLADYFGAGKPVLSLTDSRSPAGIMTARYGGKICSASDPVEIAGALMEIARNREGEVRPDFRQLFDAKNAAAAFDARLEKMLIRKPAPQEKTITGDRTPAKKALTVCVPSYNAQDTLSRALDSLLEVRNRELLEILIVDDGSTDRTAEIGKEYVRRYPETVVLVSKPNGGHGSGINQGMELARGLFYRVVDSDDWVDSRGLEDEIAYIAEAEELPDAIYTPYHIVDQTTGESSWFPQSARIESGRMYAFSELVREIGVEKFYLTMAGTTFRTELLREIGLRLKEKTFYADSEFILKPIPGVRKVIYLEKPVYKYLRGQAEQSVAPLSFVRHYPDHETIVKEIILFEQETEMPEESRKYLTHILNQHLITQYRILMEFDPEKERASTRMTEFDRWLKEKAPTYYEWTEKNLPAVRKFRTAGYDPQRLDAIRKQGRKNRGSLKEHFGRLLKKALHTPVFFNRYTMDLVRRQKDENGLIYRVYMRMKRSA